MNDQPTDGDAPEDFEDLPNNVVPIGSAQKRAEDEIARLAEMSKAKGGHATDPDSADIDHLAALPTLSYERVREHAAERLGVRKAVLDREVKAARKGANPSFNLTDTEPWDDLVVGADLLDKIVATLNRHMMLPAGAADAVALWILHAHAHDTATISPILAITSPTPECGKTSLLTILGALVPKPLGASNVTAAALFRSVEKWQPTLLVDEADTFLRGSDELRGVINSGHNKHAAFVIRTTGDDHEPQQFRTWSPKAIALIGKLPATLESRSIHLKLCRLAPGETVEITRGDRLGHLQPLARMAARWANDTARELAAADPEMPSTLTGRRADNWRHLFAIAGLAGGDWPERARRAAEALVAKDEGQTAGIMLLSDARDIFSERLIDRISSVDLATALAQIETRPWPEWSKGKPITPAQIARLLAPFTIAPSAVRIGEANVKGYKKERFDDAFSRYLPVVPSHGHKPQKTAENGHSLAVTNTDDTDDVTAQKVPKPAVTNGCDRVTAENPQTSDVHTVDDDLDERAAIIEHDGGDVA